MWAVCGPPRTGTTAMMEAVAAWTTLSVRWHLGTEWASRSQTGRNEPFCELPPHLLADAGPDDLVKILDPGVPITPTRAILMIRDPGVVADSARHHLGQLITAEDVAGRTQAFRDAGWPTDEVHITELCDQDALFARLARLGWPVVGRSEIIETRAVRP
jgi:hypothetical protein